VGGRCRSKTRYIIVRTHDWSRTNYYPLITSVSIHIKRLCRVYFVTDLSSNSSFHKTITQIVLIDRLKRLWYIMKYSIWLVSGTTTVERIYYIFRNSWWFRELHAVRNLMCRTCPIRAIFQPISFKKKKGISMQFKMIRRDERMVIVDSILISQIEYFIMSHNLFNLSIRTIWVMVLWKLLFELRSVTK
jgi:hypothetical protein